MATNRYPRVSRLLRRPSGRGSLVYCLMLGLCLLLSSSCHEVDFFSDLARDERLSGVWVYIDPVTKEPVQPVRDQYQHATGKLYHLRFQGEVHQWEEYYYTEENKILCIVPQGVGKKLNSPSVRRYHYSFSEDGRMLYLRELGAPQVATVTYCR